jgi:hypothetical protein
VNDHYSAVSMVEKVDDALTFNQPLFYFTLNLKPGTHAEEKLVPGLLAGQVLFGCTSETSMPSRFCSVLVLFLFLFLVIFSYFYLFYYFFFSLVNRKFRCL